MSPFAACSISGKDIPTPDIGRLYVVFLTARPHTCALPNAANGGHKHDGSLAPTRTHYAADGYDLVSEVINHWESLRLDLDLEVSVRFGLVQPIALCFVGHFNQSGLRLEIKKIYGRDNLDLSTEFYDFSMGSCWLLRGGADSLMGTITSLHLSHRGFVRNLGARTVGLGRDAHKTSARLAGEKTPLFPMFLKLAKRRCLMVGAGKTAEEKIPTLLRCGARVMVVAPAATPSIQAWAADEKIVWEQRRFETRDLDGTFLTVVATPSKTLNRAIYEEAKQRQILCNVVRDRHLCDFYYPAVVRRGPLQIAISTAGHSGALAQRLRKQLEAQFGPEWETWLRWLGEARSALYEDPLSPKRRRTMLHRMASEKKQAEFFGRWGISMDGPPPRK